MAYLAPATVGGAAYLAPAEPPEAQANLVGVYAEFPAQYAIDGPPVPVASRVEVTPQGAVLPPGGTLQLYAEVFGENDPSQNVTWETTLGVVDSNGLITVPMVTEDQVGTATARSELDPTVSHSVTFAVDVFELPVFRIIPVNARVAGRGTIQFSVEESEPVDPDQVLTWTTDKGEISGDGLVTAPSSNFNEQIGTVMVFSSLDPNKFASASFIVEGTATADSFTPSASRTVRILAGRQVYDTGPFWTVNGTLGPVGSKDPNATIDIPFDWSAWLADIGNPALSAIDFLLSPGLVSPGAVAMRSDGKLIGAAVLVSDGAVGSGNNSGVHTITCRITTATEPARTEDRTVVLQIREQ